MDYRIEKIIKSKDNWNSDELLKAIAQMEKNYVTFYWIGGYELLKDGTHEILCIDLKDVQDLADKYEFEYDKNITDHITLADSLVAKWNEYHDDGGGSGWIEW